jgi:hypothetical protein
LFFLIGCAGTTAVEVPPDERFGHRYEERGPGSRRTLQILPPDPDREYFAYPVVVDSLHIRHGPLSPDQEAEMQEVPVEVLVKGSFPNSCYELHHLGQERLGHFINVALEMRQPQGTACTMMVRPYRFYFQIEGLYGPGYYRLLLNGKEYPFAIRMPVVE